MDIVLDEIKDIDIEGRDKYHVNLVARDHRNGIHTIKIPVRSFEILQEVIVENWLEKQKDKV